MRVHLYGLGRLVITCLASHSVSGRGLLHRAMAGVCCDPQREERSLTDLEGAFIQWRKSAASGGEGNCVEVALSGGLVLVRHSGQPSGPVLSFSPSEWSAFLSGASNGEFDLTELGT